MRSISNIRGFTLVEVLVVIAILAIMGAIATPNFLSWLQNKGVRSASRDMYSYFRQAQVMAIKKNRNCAISFNGSSGYVVYVDENKDFKKGASEGAIATVQWAQYRDVQLDSVNFSDNGAGQPTIAFQPNMIPAVKSGLANGTVKIKNSGARTSVVIVSQSGNISLP